MQLPYANRRDAGRVLAEHMSGYRGRGDLLVLALPRGGVPVAYELAEALEAPLDLIIVRKLGVPGQEELAMGALERRVLLFPVNDPADVYTYPQLAARGYFQETEAPDGQGTYRTLGPYIRSSASPIALRLRAPRLGEHNAEVYAKLGVDGDHLAALREKGVV